MNAALVAVLLWVLACAVLGLGWLACAIVADNRRATIHREVYGDQYTRERLDRLASMQRQEKL